MKNQDSLSRPYSPIAELGTIRISMDTPEKLRRVPVYALLCCPFTFELLAITARQRKVQLPEPDGFVVTHWRSGFRFCIGDETPAGAAMNAVAYLLDQYSCGRPLYQGFQRPKELNPIPDQIDKSWFVGFHRIGHWE